MHISALEVRTDGSQTASLVRVNKMMDQMKGLKAVSVDIDLQPSTNRAGHPKRNAPFLMILKLPQRLLSGRINSIRLVLNHCVGKPKSPEDLHTVRVLRAFDYSDKSVKNWRQAIRVWYKDAKLPPISNSKLSQSQSEFSVTWVDCQNDYQHCKQHPHFHKACKTDYAVLLSRPGLTNSISNDGAETTNETLGLDKLLLKEPASS